MGRNFLSFPVSVLAACAVTSSVPPALAEPNPEPSQAPQGAPPRAPRGRPAPSGPGGRHVRLASSTCGKAKGDNTWTVPVGVAVSKVARLGKLPIKIQLAGQYMPIRPDVFGQKWNIQVLLAPVIPKPSRAILLIPRACGSAWQGDGALRPSRVDSAVASAHGECASRRGYLVSGRSRA